MTGIDRYISELLFDHDCVILPGIGGFLTNYSGARIHPIRHSFSPPGRTVIFNANLNTNDGLLIDYICRTESISYKEASTKVSDFSSLIREKITAGTEVKMNNIGSLQMGKEGNIIFSPDVSSNYLSDAFGLPSFVSPAIKRESVRERLEKQLQPKVSAPREKKQLNLRPAIGWAAGISIPVAAALFLYFYSPSIINNMGKSYASFVPTIKFSKAEHRVKTEAGEKTAMFENFRVMPEPVVEIAEPAKPTPEPPAESKPTNTLTKYQVVVGAFSELSNAESYVEELRAKNYNASIVGTSKSGLSRVSINASDIKAEAISIMESIRSTENSSAWLLRIR